MTIAILCPTRGRPQQFKRMLDSAHRTASTPVMVSAYLANDDPSVEEYAKLGLCLDDDVIFSYGPAWPTAQSWNHLAQDKLLKDYKLFMLGADDMVFSTPGWDTELLGHYNALENKIHVYALRDSRNVDGTPHPIVTREYIEAMGYFLPPIFNHWYVDTWTVAIAKFNDCFSHLSEYELIHDKPSDRGQPDQTHTGIRQMGWHERDKYVNDTCQHFLQLEKKRLADIMSDMKFRKVEMLQ